MGSKEERVCYICGQTNPRQHQDFCKDLGCSGRMVSKKAFDRKELEKTMDIKKNDTPDLVQHVEHKDISKCLLITFADNKKKLIQISDIFQPESDYLELEDEGEVAFKIEQFCKLNWKQIEPDLNDPLIQAKFS